MVDFRLCFQIIKHLFVFNSEAFKYKTYVSFDLKKKSFRTINDGIIIEIYLNGVAICFRSFIHFWRIIFIVDFSSSMNEKILWIKFVRC